MKTLVIILLSLSPIIGLCQAFSNEEQQQIDSLNSIILNSNSHDTSLAGAYVSLSEYLASTNLDTVIPLCNKTIEIARSRLKSETSNKIQSSLLRSYAGALNNVGYINQYKGEVKQALKNYQACYDIQIEINDQVGLAVTLNNLGYIYEKQGSIEEAIEVYHKSLKIREKLQDERGIAANLINLGFIYGHQGDLDKALDYYNRSLKIYEAQSNNKGMARCYNNIGYIYDSKGDNAEAIVYYEKGLKIREAAEDKVGMAGSLNNIGSLYAEQGNLIKAEKYFTKSLVLSKETNNKKDMTRSLNNLAGVYLSRGQVKKAEEYAKQSLENSQELGFPEFIMNSAGQLSEIYESENKGLKALEMYKLQILMKDSINNEATQKATAKQQAKYEYEKQKVLDDAEHGKQLAIEQEAKEKQEIITFAIAVGLGLVAIFLIFVFNRLQVTKKQKLVIEKQKVEVEKQKEVVELAHYELEEKNQEILDSIIYAKRIQNAILPPLKIVKEYLKESFIFYKPKDIVAGDFYWMEQSENKVLFAAADCTGHGVPGAMVSVVCNNGLNRSVREHGLTDPGEILNKTREIVIAEFEKSEEDVKDGMDIALCSLEGNTLKYAGAHNPLWIIRKGTTEIEEIKANKQPIGKFINPEPYKTHAIELQKGDSIYLFSDGYADQFGGEKGKKFKTPNFKKLLLSIQKETLVKQQELLEAAFKNWMGELEQLDDVCVIGVRV